MVDGRDTFFLYNSRIAPGIDKSKVIINKNNNLVKIGKFNNLNFESVNAFQIK